MVVNSKVLASAEKRKPPAAGIGRKRGVPNKVTRETREVLALLIDGNLDKAQGWLDRVATDDPGKALTLLLQMAEFTIPKMARTEVTGRDGGPVLAAYPKLEVILHKDGAGK